MGICLIEFGGRRYTAGKVDAPVVFPRLRLAVLRQQERLRVLLLFPLIVPRFVVFVGRVPVYTFALVVIVELILVEVPIVGQPPPLSWGNVNRRSASRGSEPWAAERYAVDQVQAAARDLVSTTDPTLLQVVGQEGSDTTSRQ